MAEIYEKGTQGSVLAWRAASLVVLNLSCERGMEGRLQSEPMGGWLKDLESTLLIPTFFRQTGKYTYSLLLERSSGTWLELIDGLPYPTRVFYTATGYPTKYCVVEILSNILYHIEYSPDHTRRSAGCPTSQNMAYLSEMPQMSNSQILSNIYTQ